MYGLNAGLKRSWWMPAKSGVRPQTCASFGTGHAARRYRSARAQRTELGEERLHHADEVAEGQAVVGNDALDLVELREVCCVQALVAEDAVNGKVLDRLEALW